MSDREKLQELANHIARIIEAVSRYNDAYYVGSSTTCYELLALLKEYGITPSAAAKEVAK